MTITEKDLARLNAAEDVAEEEVDAYIADNPSLVDGYPADPWGESVDAVSDDVWAALWVEFMSTEKVF